jgi:methionine aminopeptidase
MILLKSNREIELMKEAGRIVAKAHRAVKEAIAPGVSTHLRNQTLILQKRTIFLHIRF